MMANSLSMRPTRATMKLDPGKLNALAVHLHGRRIGVITRLAGDRQHFAFEQDYIDDPDRPTLSLSFKGRTGGLVTSVRVVSRRLPPFFSNLLPEGHLRTYLADHAGVKPEREFFLLAALGEDLAGAVTVIPLEADRDSDVRRHDDGRGQQHDRARPGDVLPSSLAGAQPQLSALIGASG